jgi:RHS repeat-associated protein
VVLSEAFNGTTVSPTYDNNGNLTKDADYAYTYDAWNNLVKVAAQNETDVVVAQYKFFGDDRRASKAVTNRGDLDATTYFFYDGQEIVEERDGSEDLVQQYIYGPNHIDEPVMICGTNGTYFVYTDANWNVIGLTTPASRLAEEYSYTPYGRLIAKRHTAFGDNDGDGDVDSADNTAWLATQGPGGTYDRDFDADYDGDNDSFDETAFNKNYNAAGTSVEVSGRAWSPNGNDYTYTARRLDPETLLMHYRWRTYSPTLKQFMQRDPLRYIDGPDLYQYVVGNPLRYLDPFGLMWFDPPRNPNNILNWVQGGLDVAGMIPGLGIIPDILHAGISTGRGNWADAGLSAVAAIPILGQVSTGAKWAKKGAKIYKGAKSVTEWQKHWDKLQAAYKNLKELRQALKNAKGKKARDRIRDQIRKLLQDIKGHEKEMKQKWGDKWEVGPPKDTCE